MKFIIATMLLFTAGLKAESIYATKLFQTWPQFNLQHEFASADKDMISFEETDFKTLAAQAQQKNDPMVPTNKKRVFDDILALKSPDIHYTAFMTATAGNRVSGFSQGIAMTTMLIEGELYLDAQIEHLNYNFENRYYDRHFGGEKYRLNTMLHWYPTENFSFHLGVGGLVDK